MKCVLPIFLSMQLHHWLLCQVKLDSQHKNQQQYTYIQQSQDPLSLGSQDSTTQGGHHPFPYHSWFLLKPVGLGIVSIALILLKLKTFVHDNSTPYSLITQIWKWLWTQNFSIVENQTNWKRCSTNIILY